MTLISESRLRQIIREAIEATAAEQDVLNLGFDDLQRGIDIAKKKAPGKEMGFVRDADDLYVYAAVGGNLTVGPSYAPEMFVVIHDGARPDKRSLGAVFRPDDPLPVPDQFYSEKRDETGSARPEVVAAAQALLDAYDGGNSYQFLVKNIRNGTIPAGSGAAVAAMVPPAAVNVPPAAPASDQSAANTVKADIENAASPAADGGSPKQKKSWLSGLFAKKSKAPLSPHASSEGWNKAWDRLTSDEKKIYIAALNREPSAEQMIRGAIASKTFRDPTFRDLFKTEFTGVASKGALRLPNSKRTVNNFNSEMRRSESRAKNASVGDSPAAMFRYLNPAAAAMIAHVTGQDVTSVNLRPTP
jgi:hypothetical protein